MSRKSPKKKTFFLYPGNDGYDDGFVIGLEMLVRCMVTGGGPIDRDGGVWSTDANMVMDYFAFCVQHPDQEVPPLYLRGEEGDRRSILVSVLKRLLGRENVAMLVVEDGDDCGRSSLVATCSRQFADEETARGINGYFERLEPYFRDTENVFPGSNLPWASFAGYLKMRKVS